MAWLEKHTGVAGQMLVKITLLRRGWNVGSTYVDVGGDLFATRRSGAEFTHLQVKTGTVEEREYGYSAQFNVGKDHIRAAVEPPIHYVFVASLEEGWGPCVVIAQPELQDLVVNEEMGTEAEYRYVFYVRYHRGEEGIERILCSDSDLTEYKDDFSRWQPVEDDS